MSFLNDIVEFLKGKKTYIVSVVLAILNITVALGYISPEHLTQINLVLVALGMSAIRAGITK